MTPTDSSIDALQRAAVDRLELDGAHETATARRYLALVGALERAREDDAGRDGRSAGLVAPTLLTVATVVAVESRSRDDAPRLDADAWTPGTLDDGVERCVLRGAVLVRRRRDLSVERAASLAGVATTTLEAFEKER